MRIVAGGDFGHQWTKHGTYAAELAAYVELLGFSPLEALLTATANAGPLVGERLGRIAEGYLADLVVVDGDPTADVRTAARPRARRAGGQGRRPGLGARLGRRRQLGPGPADGRAPMRVAVAYEAGQPLVVEDLEPQPLGPRDVLVRIAASGICHTDLTVIAGRSPLPLPIVPGHEACGVVEEAGPEVRRVRRGDRVLAVVSPACGTCWSCVNGMSNHCERGPGDRGDEAVRASPTGASAGAVCGCGSFAEAMVVDEASVIAVETDLPDDQLALLGCGVTTGLGAALNTAGVTPGSSVAVIGCGGVGQSVIQGARIAGAATIVAVDPPAERRQAARGASAPRTRSIPPRATRSSRCGR